MKGIELSVPTARITAVDTYDIRFPASRELVDFRHLADALTPEESPDLLTRGRHRAADRAAVRRGGADQAASHPETRS